MIVIIPDAAPDAPPDAFEPTFDFSCMTDPAPTTAPDNITLGGAVNEVVLNGIQPGIEASHSATVDACVADCMDENLLDTKTTPNMGCPAIGCPYTSDPLATGGTPLDGYLRASKTGNRTSYVYPPAPLDADIATIPVITFTQGAFGGVTLAAGVTQDPANGNLVLVLTDCSDAPITDTANIDLSIKQGGTEVVGTTEFDVSPLAAQLAGTYVVFNVPAGATEVGATYKGTPLRAHVVGSVAGASTFTGLRPGF
jgi:hypothetical protein